MTEAALDPRRAGLLVEARLGRPPQDVLEAAVVLEAWAGVPAQAALTAARAMMAAAPVAPQPSIGRLPRPRDHQGVLLDGAAFIITVIAIACWAAPLSASVGVSVVEQGLLLALPLTLAIQWSLRSRFLDRPQGVAQLADRTGVLILGAAAVLLAPSLLFGLAGMLAGLLTLTWTGGTLLIRRRWPAAYVLTILVATSAMTAGLDALAVVGVTTAVTAIVVAIALCTVPRALRRSLGRQERAAVAGVIGAGLGLALILDRSVSWTDGALPALALLPATVSSFWGSHHLRRLDQAIPRAISGVRAGEGDAGGLGWPPVRVLLGALARFVVLCGALSAGLLWLTPWLGASARGAGVLAGFALLAVATMLVALLESMGRDRWALTAVVCAVAAEAAVQLSGVKPFPGTGLVVAGALAVVLVLPAVLALLLRPARTLATALWIS